MDFVVRIDEVKFGEIKVDGKTYYSDMIVWWDGKVDFVTKRHRIGMNELAKLLKGKGKPEVIVIGTGQQGIVGVEPEVGQACSDKKIKLYSDPTPKAVDFFNGLILQGKKVAGYFHITC